MANAIRPTSPSAFIALSQKTRNALLECAEPFEKRKGTLIHHPSDAWKTAFWLDSGIVRMYYIDRDGQEHNKRFFTSDSFFWPVTSSLREEKTGFAIEAVTPISGQRWSFQSLKDAFEDSTEWLNFNHLWAERLLTHKLKREQELLQLSATERYLALCRDEPDLINTVPAHHLASYIGITPVSLSRLKKSLS
ncbi:Crp/Fnr family transcriptional regulator [Marinomonas mediterranea]|uniref:Crp/Fnr family transcriptional regulator n=1 Tax=Marinomonas mediterranea TaxID=119864 RepID=UPI002349DC0B|nr:Crp/Fnr family transcriptional regulator [Marinomonas mediterranea]WCN15079.1 Crp/Fnr family transcriptional regulator [Marinomonas mediterranea]